MTIIEERHQLKGESAMENFVFVLSAIWVGYRPNMNMDERVRGERKIRIWFLRKVNIRVRQKLGGKRKRRIAWELKINMETGRKKQLRIELMRDANLFQKNQ